MGQLPSAGVRSTADLQRLVSDEVALVSVLERMATSLRQRVLRHGPTFELVAPGFDRRFVRPFQSLTRIDFAKFTSGAAFEFDPTTRVMTVSTGHAVGILNAIISDLKQTDDKLHPLEVGRLVRLAIELFLLHEVRHFSQGVANYADVQRLKNQSEMLVGEFDLHADRDAAHGYALLRAVEESASDVESYLSYFSEALFFMGQFCFPAFKTPLVKLHKVFRALGITLMLGRYVLAERENQVLKVHFGHLPLDAVLMPEISADWSKLTIFAYTPDLELVTIDYQIAPEIIRSICARLDSGNFGLVLEDVIRLLRRIQII